MNFRSDVPVCEFVVAVNQEAVLAECLLSSPLWNGNDGKGFGAPPLHIVRGASSAAAAFNPLMATLEARHAASGPDQGPAPWLVWVHQDVHLPADWYPRWLRALTDARARWPQLAVAGVYGLRETQVPGSPVRAGAVLDRGTPLLEDAELPCEATSLDELLVAVNVGCGLRMDADLGFDFYATDLCLAAHERGWKCAVLEACCEHRSTTPRSGLVPRRVIERIARSGAVFEAKWTHRLPLSTPCFDIRTAGDVALFLAAHTTPSDGAS